MLSDPVKLDKEIKMSQDDIYAELKSKVSSKKIITAGIVLAILVFILILNPFVIINAGERGVVTTFGEANDFILDPGLHLKIPLVQKVIPMDVQINKVQIKAAASTKDLQDTHSTIVLNYHINPVAVNKLYKDVGLDYKLRVIDPNIQEVVKAISAQYNAKELITLRSEVSLKIGDTLKKRIAPYHIVVDTLSIVNFSFSEQFTQAIEDKQTAEQKALKAEQDLKRIEFEAKQKIEMAKAEAQSLRLQRDVITNQVLELRRIEAKLKAIEKWNGQLPKVTASTVPFLDIHKEQ